MYSRWLPACLAAPLAAAASCTLSAMDSSGVEGGSAHRRIVLFVCTSNTCRSPMAEVIAKTWFAQRCGCEATQLKALHGWDIRSGGLTDEVCSGRLKHYLCYTVLSCTTSVALSCTTSVALSCTTSCALHLVMLHSVHTTIGQHRRPVKLRKTGQ